MARTGWKPRTLVVASRAPPVRGKGLSLPGGTTHAVRPPFGPTSAQRARREEAVMALSLPANPDLERFRRDARRLQRAVRAAEPEALAYAARHHPEGVPSDPTTFALADAQLVVARAYGLPSWPRLRAYLRAAAPLTRDPAALDPFGTSGAKAPTRISEEESASAVVALACLTYTERDEPARWTRAAQLLANEPNLVDRSIVVAAVAGDADAVARHLAADASAAR